ncbi:unnamed protein product [Fraxinus pennsylvanica]|uniref:PWWP domain-containing protein n=1 Tax=Fraxinus pennsylvanica TaxID=56036 RepID=A0AAD2A2U4_9LAMI|nr:unnamed protein product [Fraxinus pennsylvanica]
MGRPAHEKKKAIDASVGGLVWVRRQNGYWWPGQILSQDELPKTTLPVPRPGTPIKLLGREDISLGWYNLEASKRVKVFRCGEFDSFIEKAKASTSNSSKKAGKYAHRGDAIIHALKIESACIQNYHPENTDVLFMLGSSAFSGIEELNELGSFVWDSGAQWQLKGKRKSNSRKMEVRNKHDSVYMSGTNLDSSFGKSGPTADIEFEMSSVMLMEPHTRGQADEPAIPQRLMQYRQSCSTVNPKYDASEFYLEDREVDSGLYDVTLEVDRRYQPQPVPYISPKSNLTGKSIIGHPLTVDVLEGGAVIEKRPHGRPRTKNVRPQQLIPPVKSRKWKKHDGSLRKSRKLSSLTGSPEPQEKPVVNMLVKPVLACIPLKVVFSRLNAALNNSI